MKDLYIFLFFKFICILPVRMSVWGCWILLRITDNCELPGSPGRAVNVLNDWVISHKWFILLFNRTISVLDFFLLVLQYWLPETYVNFLIDKLYYYSSDAWKALNFHIPVTSSSRSKHDGLNTSQGYPANIGSWRMHPSCLMVFLHAHTSTPCAS